MDPRRPARAGQAPPRAPTALARAPFKTAARPASRLGRAQAGPCPVCADLGLPMAAFKLKSGESPSESLGRDRRVRRRTQAAGIMAQ